MKYAIGLTILLVFTIFLVSNHARAIANLTKIEMSEEDKIAKSLRNVKEICIGINAYAADNDGNLPQELREIKDYINDYSKVSKCPISGEMYRYSYEYKSLMDKDYLANPVIYSAKFDGGIIKGYLDAHVVHELSK